MSPAIKIDTKDSKNLESHVFGPYIQSGNVFVELVSPMGGDDVMFHDDEEEGEYEVRWVRSTENTLGILEQIYDALEDSLSDKEHRELVKALLEALDRHIELHFA